MAYATHSEGFRPGGFNRTATSVDGSVIHLKGVAPFTSGKIHQFLKPAGYESDSLINNEIGLKSEWFEHRLQANISVYQMDWKNVQLPLFDPVHLGNTTFDINGPTYRIKGIELQLVARVFEGLHRSRGRVPGTRPSQTDAPCLESNNPAPANPTPLGTCITQVKGLPYTNPYGVLGARRRHSHRPSCSTCADGTTGRCRAATTPSPGPVSNHIGSQSNEPASFPDGNDPAQNPPTTTLLRYEIPAYTTYDAGLGVAKDNWSATLTGNNLSNSDAVSNISSGQFIKSEVPIRPRVITFGLGYKF